MSHEISKSEKLKSLNAACSNYTPESTFDRNLLLGVLYEKGIQLSEDAESPEEPEQPADHQQDFAQTVNVPDKRRKRMQIVELQNTGK